MEDVLRVGQHADVRQRVAVEHQQVGMRAHRQRADLARQAGMAVAQALVTQLAAVDPARTGGSIEAAEAMWAKFGLLHRRPALPGHPPA
ncbi:hypothetical protein [Nonomuraea polychroma]|uniref:hypothetical protein n=1 Tax=Nonomuraea polychroma TaxID=46176 RepID=UPI0030C8847A